VSLAKKTAIPDGLCRFTGEMTNDIWNTQYTMSTGCGGTFFEECIVVLTSRTEISTTIHPHAPDLFFEGFCNLVHCAKAVVCASL
jgi:hypothetical protein